MQISRNTAVKCRITELQKGRFKKGEGWESSVIETDYADISRANVFATIVSLSDNSAIVDDGTGRMEVRTCQENHILKDKEVGDVVKIIGKPKEYNDNKYLVPEIIKKIDNTKWIKYRNKELKSRKKINRPTNINKSKTSAREEKIRTDDMKQKPRHEKVLDKIKELDQGKGAEISEIIDSLKDEKVEGIIEQLIEVGEIFELKRGVVKIL